MGSAASPPPGLLTASNPPFRPITKKPLVSLETRNVQPPSNVYVTTDDRLAVNVWNSAPGAVLTFFARILKADGEIVFDQETLTLLSDRSQQSFAFNMPEGFLLSLAVAQNGAGVFRGQTWCEVGIIREGPGANSFTQTILSDYVVSRTPIGYPGGRQINSLEGPGFVQQYAIPDGTPGLDVHINPPTNARWLVHAIHFHFVTDANVASREVIIAVGFPSIEAGVFPANTRQDGGFDFNYFGAAYSYLPGGVPLSEFYVPFPSLPIINNNVAFSLSSDDTQVGDQFQIIRILVEEWIEPSQ